MGLSTCHDHLYYLIASTCPGTVWACGQPFLSRKWVGTVCLEAALQGTQWQGWWCGWMEGTSWPLSFATAELAVWSRFRHLKKLNHETCSCSRLGLCSPHKFQQERSVKTPPTPCQHTEALPHIPPWGFCLQKYLFPCSCFWSSDYPRPLVDKCLQHSFSSVLLRKTILSALIFLFLKVSDVIHYPLLETLNLPLEIFS